MQTSAESEQVLSEPRELRPSEVTPVPRGTQEAPELRREPWLLGNQGEPSHPLSLRFDPSANDSWDWGGGCLWSRALGSEGSHALKSQCGPEEQNMPDLPGFKSQL